jgi:hypothetical protein
MTQLCRRPFQPHDSLSRDHMLHVADSGGDLVSRLVLGVLIGVLLAIATLLSEGPEQPVDRLALPESAPPQIVLDRDGPWNQPAR